MTDHMLKSLVTEAVPLDREINEKSDPLKELKAELVAEARWRQSDFESTDGGGRRWTTEGSDGCIARVTFPAPTLKAKIDEEGKVIEKIKNLAGGVFTHLFVPTIRHKCCDYPLLVNRKPFRVTVVTPSFLYESISAETFFAMRATCLRSPIDLQAVNGCRRPGDKTHSVIFDAVACARATRPIFSR